MARRNPHVSIAASSVSVSECPRHAAAAPLHSRSAAQRHMVVDLTVETDPVSTASRNHGLMTCRRQVDDREPPMPHREADVALKPIT